MIVMIFGVNCIALSSKGHTHLQNDVLASEVIEKVHRAPEVTEKRHPSKNEDQTRKKIFCAKFCLYSVPRPTACGMVEVDTYYRAKKLRIRSSRKILQNL